MKRSEYRQCLKTINRRMYNCGGFALETFDWYCPLLSGYVDWGDNFENEDMDEITEDAVNCMLEDFPSMRVLSSMHDKLNPGEYMIAFRISLDGDFHFMKRGDNHNWYHKMGGMFPINHATKEEVMKPWDGWCYPDRYDGPIVFLAKMR